MSNFLNDNHNHSFNVGIRKAVGCTDAALIHFHITYWVRHNFTQKKKDHYHDGRWWTYFSQQEIANHFEYLNRFQIMRCIKKLEESDLIITGNFNKKAYDKTTWYTLSDKAISILGLGYAQPLCENAQSDSMRVSDEKNDSNPDKYSLCENAQGTCESAQPIPNTNANTDRRTYVPNVRSFEDKTEERRIRDLIKNALGGKPLNLAQAGSLIKNHSKEANIEWSLNNYLRYLQSKHSKTIRNKVACFIYHINNYGFFQDEVKTKDEDPTDRRNREMELNKDMDLDNLKSESDFKNREQSFQNMVDEFEKEFNVKLDVI